MTSDITPNAGKTRIYTSGWPKIQKKCCHNTGEPPAWASKNFAPKNRSKTNMICAAESGGKNKKNKKNVTKTIPVNKDIPQKGIPLPRYQQNVTITFPPPVIVPTPPDNKPSHH